MLSAEQRTASPQEYQGRLWWSEAELCENDESSFPDVLTLQAGSAISCPHWQSNTPVVLEVLPSQNPCKGDLTMLKLCSIAAN